MSDVIPNPESGGINTSPQVARMIKNAGGAAFAGSLLSLPTPVTISEGGDATIKVWSQRQTDVTFKLEGTPDSELELSHSGSGWEELTYDFSTSIRLGRAVLTGRSTTTISCCRRLSPILMISLSPSG